MEYFGRQELKELQKIELEILLDVDSFCKKNSIQYFLGEGTLLGAIRHHGFIPWDDDIDLLMKREDFDRFLDLAKEGLKDKYEIQHWTTVKNYWIPIIKVRKITGEIKYRQSHISHLTENNGPFIDIFPMDYTPDLKSISQVIQFRLIRYYRRMLTLKLNLRKADNLNRKVILCLSHLFSVNGIHKRLEKTFRKFNHKEKNYVATLSTYHMHKRQVLPSNLYRKALNIEFEGYQLPVPEGYHDILTAVYDNYMELPPEEKREIKHSFYQAAE